MSLDRLDPTIIEELFELDPAEGLVLVRDLVSIFFAEAPGRVDRIRCGLAQGDPVIVSQAAHAMRGGASGLGAVDLAAACNRVELQARTGELSGLTEEVDAIEFGLPRLAQRLEEHIARMAREAAGA